MNIEIFVLYDPITECYIIPSEDSLVTTSNILSANNFRNYENALKYKKSCQTSSLILTASKWKIQKVKIEFECTNLGDCDTCKFLIDDIFDEGGICNRNTTKYPECHYEHKEA